MPSRESRTTAEPPSGISYLSEISASPPDGQPRRISYLRWISHIPDGGYPKGQYRGRHPISNPNTFSRSHLFSSFVLGTQHLHDTDMEFLLLDENSSATAGGSVGGRPVAGIAGSAPGKPSVTSFCSADACSVRKNMTRAGRLLIGGSNDTRNACSITGGAGDGAQEGGQVWNGGDVASEQNAGLNLIADISPGHRERATPDQDSKRAVEEVR